MTADLEPDATLVHLGGDAWCHPDLAGLLGPIDDLLPHPENPRNGDTDAIVESLRINGLYRPVYVQRSTRHILAGNHTTAALRELGATQAPRIWLDVDDRQARKILLADNRTADLGRYDEGLLLGMLRDLDAEDQLTGTGWTPDDLELLADGLTAAEGDLDGDEDRAPTTSEMLALADVSWGEPDHRPRHGQVWRVGLHTLVLAKVHTEHRLWRGLLDDNTVLCPYPEPYITTTELAAVAPMLLVQPNPFLAGHLLDKHCSTHPGDTVELVAAPAVEEDA